MDTDTSWKTLSSMVVFFRISHTEEYKVSWKHFSYIYISLQYTDRITKERTESFSSTVRPLSLNGLTMF